MSVKKYSKLKEDTTKNDVGNGVELLQMNDSALDTQPLQRNSSANTHINVHPSKWDKHQVRAWMKQKRLQPSRDLNSGQALLQLNPDHFAQYPDNEKLFREVAKLQLIEYKWPKPEKTQEYQVNEMERRIKEFQDKWDKILWIQHYKEINNDTPSTSTIALELGLSMPLAQIYKEYYENMPRYLKKDLYELFCNFDVYNDCLIWWYLLITMMKSYPSKALWLIFSRVALITPHKISIRLLQKYQTDLTRFDAKELNKVTEKICIGSKYPVCTALEIARWFQNRAALDVARGTLFLEVGATYIEAARDYLSIIESDHLATILLEVKSDMNNMNALDMSLEYELTGFVTNDVVERITTSMMNDWEFLRPKHKEEAFEINPLSIDLMWKKLWHFYSIFYFTPLGYYITTITLYIGYLILFTVLSFSKFRVYDEMTEGEIVFWIFNMGYVVYEILQAMGEGLEKYFSSKSNYFDTLISIVFLISISIRVHANRVPNPCETPHSVEPECWYYSPENVTFMILWAIATITLYVRLLLFCVLSRTLGPMVKIIFDMKDDIITFFTIMFCIFCGFVISMMFLMEEIHLDFTDFLSSLLTLFNSLMGEFAFDGFKDAEEGNTILLVAGHFFMIIYLIVSALVLLNILIAMMAKTFDTIHEDTTSTIMFSKFALTYSISTSTAFTPPPLNIVAMALNVLFNCIELMINWPRLLCHLCCRRKSKMEFEIIDLSLSLMPDFLRERKLGLDDQIVSVYKEDHKDHWPWVIKTNEGPTKCRITDYDEEKMKHTVEFPYEVSIEPHVLKKKKWYLDLLDLAVNSDDLLDISQFVCKVDQKWVNEAHRDMKSGWWKLVTCSPTVTNNCCHSDYWICGFCRSYVKTSRVSLMRLGEVLKLNNIELGVVRAANPNVCSHCYRVRLERDRYQLVSEILSLWIFYIIVGPILVIIFSFLVFLNSPIMYIKHWNEQLANVIDRGKKNGCLHRLFRLSYGDQCYCKEYYDSTLNKMLKAKSGEDHLFDEEKAFDVWGFLHEAKHAIDVVELKEKINDHMMTITTDNPLTEQVFLDEYVAIKELESIEDAEQLSKAIYNHIAKNTDDEMPLHLFRKYPFDSGLLLNDIQEGFLKYRKKIIQKRYDEMKKEEKLQEFEEKYDNGLNDKQDIPIHLMQCNLQQFIDIMCDELHLFYCRDNDQREFILRQIEKNDLYIKEHNMYHKFMKYMNDLESIVQKQRNIKTLLRDIKTTMDERGIDSLVSAEELQFLCQDLNEILVVPIFNVFATIVTLIYKKSDMDLTNKKIFLWDIRNILMCIDYLQQTVKHVLLHKHCTVKISKEELIELILKTR
eukprot:254946_1